MLRHMLKSKVHRTRVTNANLNYMGSITIDPVLLDAADIREFERVTVVDVDNGARFETYVILGEPGKGECCVNGGAARLVHSGDTVIILTYGTYEESELENYEPRIVHVDHQNRPIPGEVAGPNVH